MNHTFASMESCDPNPYVAMHKQDAMIAWRLNEESTWRDETTNIVGSEDASKINITSNKQDKPENVPIV